MTVGFNFELRNSGSKNARRGKIDFPNKFKSIETPACITYTLRGAVPHLVADNLSPLPTHLIQISLEHFLEQEEPSSFKYPFGIHKYLHLENSIIFCDVRDSRQLSEVSLNTDKYVSVETHSGVRQVTPELWKEAIASYCPDIVAPLGDLVTDKNASKRRIVKSVDRSLRWLDELLPKAKELGIPVFAPVMGHSRIEERIRSAELTSKRDVQGFIINVLALKEDTSTCVKSSTDNLPQNKPRIAYGLSCPESILEGVSNGIDLFDGSYVYEMAEKGRAITFKFGSDLQDTLKTNQSKAINLCDPSMAHEFSAIDATCGCHACSRPHSKAYIHHLLNAHEMLAPILLMSHNIYQLDRFMNSIRESIEQNRFEEDKAIFMSHYHCNNEEELVKSIHLKKKRTVFVKNM